MTGLLQVTPRSSRAITSKILLAANRRHQRQPNTARQLRAESTLCLHVQQTGCKLEAKSKGVTAASKSIDSSASSLHQRRRELRAAPTQKEVLEAQLCGRSAPSRALREVEALRLI